MICPSIFKSHIELMYNMNNNESKTVTCGTPQLILISSTMELLYFYEIIEIGL